MSILRILCAKTIACLTVAILWWNDVLLRVTSTSFMEIKKKISAVFNIYSFVQKLQLNQFDCVSAAF